MQDYKASPAMLMQALPTKIGRLAATGRSSGIRLPFPQLSYLETHPTHAAVRAAVEQWGKAFLLAMNAGNITPVRPYWLCSCIHPDHRPARCPFAHCKQKGCRGNAIVRSTDGQSYSLVVPHHKTSSNSR